MQKFHSKAGKVFRHSLKADKKSIHWPMMQIFYYQYTGMYFHFCICNRFIIAPLLYGNFDITEFCLLWKFRFDISLIYYEVCRVVCLPAVISYLEEPCSRRVCISLSGAEVSRMHISPVTKALLTKFTAPMGATESATE